MWRKSKQRVSSLAGDIPSEGGPLCIWYVGLAGLLLTSFASQANEVPTGAELNIRLTSPIASYSSKAGDSVSAVLTVPIEVDGNPVLPSGISLSGRVDAVRRVGWGFVHERASLHLEFDTLVFPDAPPVRIESRLVEIENAREVVDHAGTVRGIRATGNITNSISSRLIHLPTWPLFPGDTILLAYKLFAPGFPESEIHLPAGTDLRLQLTAPATVPQLPDTRPPELDRQDVSELVRVMGTLPTRSRAGKQRDLADFVNVVFLGSRAQLEIAFLAAGWSASVPWSKGSLLRYFGALVSNQGYKTAPMSNQWLEGRPPDLTRQKSFDSFGKRHHVRLWKYPLDSPLGDEMWVATATQDVGVLPSFRHHGFIHRVDSNIDREREKVVSDLTFAGCVSASSLVERPDFLRQGQTPSGEMMVTDGRFAVVQLRSCGQDVAPDRNLAALRTHPRRFQRVIRRQVLTVRNELLRGNPFWVVYDTANLVRHYRRLSPTAGRDSGIDKEPISGLGKDTIPHSGSPGEGGAETSSPEPHQ
jgi:hypothetical protein